MRPARLLAAAAAAAALLVAAATATAAPRPAYRIPAGHLPATAAKARAILDRALDRAPAGSQTADDIRFALRLGTLHLTSRDPIGRRRTVLRTLQVNAWWFARHRAPGERVVIRDPDGILSTYWERRGFSVNPVATAGRWYKLNSDLDTVELARALLPFAVDRHAGRRHFLLWEYYDVPMSPGTIRPGASGMAQGRMVQLLSTAYHLTGRARFADAARGALATFTVPVGRGGVLSRVRTPGRPLSSWFVERAYPGYSPWEGAALNGFMVTVLNLSSSSTMLSARPVRASTGPSELRAKPRAPGARRAGALTARLAATGERTLLTYLPLHDTGSWSLYALQSFGRPWRSYLATPRYHCYHVTLLRMLDAQAPNEGFGSWAAKWAGYARRAGVDCATA
jgi:hypothetical protein